MTNSHNSIILLQSWLLTWNVMDRHEAQEVMLHVLRFYDIVNLFDLVSICMW